MSVLLSTRSANCPDPGCLQPSGSDVVLQSGTPNETEPCALSPKDVLIALSSIILRMQTNVPSNDAWYLTLIAAQHDAVEAGVNAGAFQKVVQKLEALRKSNRAKNPMAEMMP